MESRWQLRDSFFFFLDLIKGHEKKGKRVGEFGGEKKKGEEEAFKLQSLAFLGEFGCAEIKGDHFL